MTMFQFDPNANPYADDLLRLDVEPRSRYSDSERHALARIFAGKLYKLCHVENLYSALGWNRWETETSNKQRVEIEVIFEGDDRRSDLLVISKKQTDLLIVLSVSKRGVVEVFNGYPDEMATKYIAVALERIRRGITSDFAIEEGAIARRLQTESIEKYSGTKVTKDANNQRPPLGRGGAGGDREVGRGRDRRGGGRGGGDGAGGDSPGDKPGRGGIGELINHPVLFSVEPQILESLLNQI